MNQLVITYLNESGMNDNTTWANDAEIIGSASFMGIDTKVYRKYGEELKWLTYPCSLTLTQFSEHAIALIIQLQVFLMLYCCEKFFFAEKQL